MAQSVSIAKKKLVEVGGIKVEVKSLPVRKYAEVFGKFDNLMVYVKNAFVAYQAGEDVTPYLTVALLDETEKLFDALAIATGVERELILDADGEEVFELVAAVIEINRIPQLVGKIGAAIKAQFSAKAA